MTNWCTNNLFVRGASTDLEGFRAFAAGNHGDDPKHSPEFCFEAFAPPPSGLACKRRGQGAQTHVVRATNVALYGYESQQQFRLEVWNTTGEPQVVDVHLSGGELYYCLLTAWTPPLGVILAASNRFPSLDFWLQYTEALAGFVGEFSCRAGTVTRDVCDEWVRDDLEDREAR